MNNRHNEFFTVIFSIVIMAGTAFNLAQASESKEKEAKELQLFSQAKITLTDAIKAAEHETGGKAIEAEIDDESSTVQFEIEVIKDGKVYEVEIDGITGKVLKVSLDDESKEDDKKETENEKE